MANGSAPPMSPTSAQDRQWHIVGRWEEYEGEGRANLLRLIAVTAFYAVELTHYHGLNLWFIEMPAGGASRRFHLAVTMLVVVWAMLCLGVFLARVFFESDESGVSVLRLQPRNEKYRPQTVPSEQVAGLYKAVFRYQRVDDD